MVQRTSRIQPPRQPDSPDQPGSRGDWSPPRVETIKDTALNLSMLSELVIKTLYYGGVLTGYQVTERVKLPYTGVVEQVLDFLKREQLVEIRGGSTISQGSWQYILTGRGMERAREAMIRTQYVGPCPVSLDDYVNAINAQNVTDLTISAERLNEALADLVISQDLMNRLGPAVNSWRAIFLYGPPGNGKTTIAESVGRTILGADLWIPFSVDVDGQIIRIFDNVNHTIIEETDPKTTGPLTLAPRDPRWVRIRRPVIAVGGELTMDGLDLVWDETNRYYEAPYQIKANGGMLLIDDFGRQQIRPRDLLNRWIVPLEKRVDYLSLHTGRKIEMPFHVLTVFSTNLDPTDLVDEAFLRRIRHKIEITDPTLDQFRTIFQNICQERGVPYEDNGLKYLIKEWYYKYERNLRCVHPRDIVDQILDIARYLQVMPKLSKDLLDRAASAYFVEL